ncbi:SEC-C metal-binding domain-containing protein [Marinactinospora thermotolerans]|uniref:SEC-C motif-containing protein n=1 Tax=Marinactinospora thermotolerans DSM 45154 TaxID=1122192 RepID=A0A1T4SXU4_9ACTN|nr:SEC-C metal-binding domain-containing protein [Marinactinospora thermotolerans]SKA32949.1 SEC-C motif-containing protein [Marinactinospora thermotolerans DSM 45154]
MKLKPGAGLLVGRSREQVRAEALRLEADAEAFPGDRGEILCEAAGLWHRLGESDRALDLCARAIACGEEGVGFARLRRMEVFAAEERWEEFEAELGALRSGRIGIGPAHLVAELLESLGRYRAALEFYDLACAPLRTDLDRIDPDDLPRYLVQFESAEGRARTRAALGIAPDDLDAVVARSYEEESEPFNGVDCAAPQPVAGPPVAAFVPRSDLARAYGRGVLLPGELASDEPAHYFGVLEREWWAFGGRIALLPVRLDDYLGFAARAVADPRSGRTCEEYLRHLLERRVALAWPPRRNAPCWCGAAAKYKKCCGSLWRPGR